MEKNRYEEYTATLTPENCPDFGVADTLALAAGESSYMDGCDEWEISEQDEAEKYIRDNFDYEAGMLDALNAGRLTMAALGEDAQDYADILARYGNPTQKLMLGAYIALEYPAVFARMLEAYREAIEDTDWTEAETLEKYAPGLAKAIEDAKGEASADVWRQWMHGDRRDWAGVECAAARKLGAESVDYRKDHTAAVTFTAEAAAEFLDGYETDEYTEKIRNGSASPRVVGPAIIRRIIGMAQATANRQKAERDARRAQYEKERAHKAEREAQKQKERRQRLEAMTR